MKLNNKSRYGVYDDGGRTSRGGCFMRQHRLCPQCHTTYGDASEEFAKGECGYCMECAKCDFQTGDFDEMYGHHHDNHGHNKMQPLYHEGNFTMQPLLDPVECTCSPH